jgi:hypothetical protein
MLNRRTSYPLLIFIATYGLLALICMGLSRGGPLIRAIIASILG